MKLKKGDNVQIMAGKDKGKRGKVSIVDRTDSRVLIQGLNQVKKNKRPTKQGEKGEIIAVSHFLDSGKVMLVCNSCNKPVRVGYRIDGEAKVRFCKKCKASI